MIHLAWPTRPHRAARAPALAAAAAAAALVLALAACSDPMQVGSVHVKSGSIGAQGGALVVTPADHPQLAGTAIVFPPEALAGPTLIAIGISDATITLDAAAAGGPTLYFEPVGLALGVAATVTVPYDKSVGAPRLLVRTLAGGEVRDLTARITNVDDDAALVTFELDRLGHVQPQAVPLSPIDAGCNAPQCPPIDAGCAFGACPPPDAATTDAGAIDAAGGTCPLFCPPGTMCTPALGMCTAVCGNQICPQGQGCNPQNVCVNQCGSGGALTFLCPPNQVCNFASGTCHAP